jgi:hypothetical protein
MRRRDTAVGLLLGMTISSGCQPHGVPFGRPVALPRAEWDCERFELAENTTPIVVPSAAPPTSSWRGAGHDVLATMTIGDERLVAYRRPTGGVALAMTHADGHFTKARVDARVLDSASSIATVYDGTFVGVAFARDGGVGFLRWDPRDGSLELPPRVLIANLRGCILAPFLDIAFADGLYWISAHVDNVGRHGPCFNRPWSAVFAVTPDGRRSAFARTPNSSLPYILTVEERVVSGAAAPDAWNGFTVECHTR